MKTAAFIALILMLSLPRASALAEEPVPAPTPAPAVVASITFDYPGDIPASLPALAGLKAGDAYSARKVREGIKLMYLTGRFRDIVVVAGDTGQGLALTYILVPRRRVTDIAVEGTDELSEGQVEKAMALKEGDYLDYRLVEKSIGGIKKLSADEGLVDGYAEIDVEQFDELTAGLVVTLHEGRPYVVREVAFTGDTVLPEEGLYDALGFEVGDVIKGSALEESVEYLAELYVAEDYVSVVVDRPRVSYSDGQADVVIEIDAGPRLSVEFEGNEEFSDKKLKGQLGFWTDRDASAESVAENMERLIGFYRSEGYYHVAASSRTEQAQTPPTYSVRFVVVEGPRARLREVSFAGNEHVEDDELMEAIGLREASVLRSGFVTDDAVEGDAQRIRALYEKKGFISAEVRPSALRFDDEGRDAYLTFEITEGVRTTVREVAFIGNSAVSSEDLALRVPTASGVPYDPADMFEGKDELISLYSQRGFIHASVDARAALSDDGSEASLVYTIDEGYPVYVGKLVIRGNHDTRDRALIREVMVAEGDPYDYERILRSQQRIFRLGFMSQVRVQPIDPDVPERVKDLLLSVSEREAGAVEFGVGYGDFDRYRGFAEVSYRNLFGLAHRASLRGELSTKEVKSVLSYRWPWFMGWRMDARANLVYLDGEKPNYKIEDLIASAALDKAITERITATLTYQYEKIELDAPPGAVLAPEDRKKSNIASVTPSVLLDFRDNPFNPTKGSVHGVTLRYATTYLGSTVDFVKITAQTSWYFPVYWGVVFGVSARGGLEYSLSGDFSIPISERFFLGGASSLRGYEFESVAPRGFDGTPVGGDAMLLFNAELRVPLPYGFGLVGFLDAGNVWLTDKTASFAALSQSGSDGLRYGAGAGVRYDTPVGPLRLDYGIKLDPLPGEAGAELHFTLGHAF